MIVFAKSEESVQAYLKNSTVGNLSEAVEKFKVYTNSDGRGAGGELGYASGAQIANELGEGKSTADAIAYILREGKSKGKIRVNESYEK